MMKKHFFFYGFFAYLKCAPKVVVNVCALAHAIFTLFRAISPPHSPSSSVHTAQLAQESRAVQKSE